MVATGSTQALSFISNWDLDMVISALSLARPMTLDRPFPSLCLGFPINTSKCIRVTWRA